MTTPRDVASLVRSAPRFSLSEASTIARDLYRLEGDLSPLPSERDQNFLLDAGPAGRRVLKIANASERYAALEAQNAAMRQVRRADPSVGCPEVALAVDGSEIARVEVDGHRAHFVRLVSFVSGTPLAHIDARPPAVLRSLGWFLGRLTRALDGFSHPGARRAIQWDLTHAATVIRDRLGAVEERTRRSELERIATRFETDVAPALGALPRTVIHNDANDHNVLVLGGAVDAILDFGDLVESQTVCELAVGATYALLGQAEPLVAGAAVAGAYHDVAPLARAECEVLHDLIVARLAVSVSISAEQRALDPTNDYLSVSEAAAWSALDRLLQMSPRDARAAYARACFMTPAATSANQRRAIIEARREHLGSSLSVHYDEPLEVVRGWMQYLYDPSGRAYVDCVNNVCHVGHCHPRVVQAAQRQIARLNTNTRYLYDELATYVRRLTSLFPEPLSVCYLVNSGSEANELAVRLARAHTGRRDMIVVDHGYHGNTTTLVELSPYKYAGPGGAGRPPWVHQVEMPDVYRGRHRDPATAGRAYASDVERAMSAAAARGGAAAFLCESILGCGGQIPLPTGYLMAAYAAAHAHGALCIADEVQVGFGRVGTHRWAFETQGVVPDIVTLGKPIGNGHPLGAVITTSAVAASFDTGMEYFNTFGGNPVSCAIGCAVLDVLDDERLQERARAVGDVLTRGLRQLATRHAAIGDVRGLGLFLGVDLVENPTTREPATRLAHRVVNHLRDEGVLVTTEGPGDNVLKLKPPLAFTAENAAFVVAQLDAALRAVGGGRKRSAAVEGGPRPRL